MLKLDKNRILNESKEKSLIREFENLKNDYSTFGALQYMNLYENESLDFILDQSRYIFAEPVKGYDFYKSIIESVDLPFHRIVSEAEKVEDFCNAYQEKMSDEQKEMMLSLRTLLESKKECCKNCTAVQELVAREKDKDDIDKIYAQKYEIKKELSKAAPSNDDVAGRAKDSDEELLDLVESFIDSDACNLVDLVNIASNIEDAQPLLLEYVDGLFTESPKTEDEFTANSFAVNVLSRMMRDSYMRERVSSIHNMNLRHLLMGISGVENRDYLESVKEEVVRDYNPNYSSPLQMINRLYENAAFDEIDAQANAEEKYNRLAIEKALLEMDVMFLMHDYTSMEEASYVENSLVQKLVLERHLPNPESLEGEIELLNERREEVEKELKVLEEKYFSAGGGPSKIIARSTGEEHPQDSENFKNSSSTKSSHDEEKEDDDDEEDDLETRVEKRVKKEQDKKASASNVKAATHADFLKSFDDDDDEDDEEESVTEAKDKEEYPEVEKPDKKPLAQRIQNKAIDSHVQFRKNLAKTKRGFVDVKNAAKASAKTPKSIIDSFKQEIEKWDEMDDDARKEYIIKPGVRKKYFKAFKYVLEHYVAFLINPILNVVLAICHGLGKSKDIRIRNELVRELKAEIKVTEEKIEDARKRDDDKQKYQLIRIKEKLEAEMQRVNMNAATF